MNMLKGPMMQTMMAMRSKLAALTFEGRAGQDLVVARFRKTEDFTTKLDEITIDARLLKEHPERVPALIKEAINDGLGREMQEMAKVMPRDMFKQ